MENRRQPTVSPKIPDCVPFKARFGVRELSNHEREWETPHVIIGRHMSATVTGSSPSESGLVMIQYGH